MRENASLGGEKGTPMRHAERMSALRELGDLITRCRLALECPELVDIAGTFTPTGSYEKAKEFGFSDERAQACRFLAIIRRDHDKNDGTFEHVVTDPVLVNDVLPGIHMLEQFAGGKLRIIGPEDRGLTLSEYLVTRRPRSINVELEIVGYKVKLRFSILSLKPEQSYYVGWKVTSPYGKTLEDKNYESSRGARGNLRIAYMKFYDFLEHALYSTTGGSPITPLALLIKKDLVEQGTEFPLELWRSFGGDSRATLERLIRFGKYQEIQQVAKSVKRDSIARNLDPRGLTLLEYEASCYIARAKRNIEANNPSIPFLEKLQSGLLFAKRYGVIPGDRKGKSYNILICCNYISDNWYTILEKLGYGGSVVALICNYDGFYHMAEAGQCDALIVEQHGHSRKDWVLQKVYKCMQESMATRGITDIPETPGMMIDHFDISESSIKLKGFLHTHCPLY